MTAAMDGVVIDTDGRMGRIEASTSGDDAQVSVRLDDGRLVLVPRDTLTRIAEGKYTLPFSLPARTAPEQNDGQGKQIVVPVLEEMFEITKRTIEIGGVRVHKTVHERQETVDVPLIEETFEVERIPVGRIVDGPVAVRYEGDVIIVPLLEEVLVVEKRLLLREEVYVRRKRVETHRPQQVMLRREEVEIERFEIGAEDVSQHSE